MVRKVTRRRLVSFAGLGALAAVGGCVYSVTRPVAALATPSPSPGPVTGQLGGRIRIHMFQTGWVAVKEEHKAFSGPASLRISAIMASQS